jgi:hypothetical protein
MKAMRDGQGNLCNQTNFYLPATIIGYEIENKSAAEMKAKIDRSSGCMSRLMTSALDNYTFWSVFSDSAVMTIGFNFRNQNFGFDMGSYQTQTASNYINFVSRNGQIEHIELEDVFKNDSLLREEFIIALQKRDDLNIDCSAPEKLKEIIKGKFSLSELGVHLYLDGYYELPVPPSGDQLGMIWIQHGIQRQPANILIPTERLLLHDKTKWLGSLLDDNSN